MSKYRVAIVLQETTDVPGRWRTVNSRIIGTRQNRVDAEMNRVVAVVAAASAVDQLENQGDPHAKEM